MEDRYLFRGKRLDNGEWLEGHLYCTGEHGYISDKYADMVEVDSSTICQCTGLRDKIGKLIWENDLVKYPRTPEADCRLLEDCGAAFVFAPSVEEMYPEPDTRQFSYAPLDTVMEGAFRPGHFNGVCQIVSKLFDAVKPDRAYFGEKDFQQLAIIREMVRQMKFPLEIVGCPIVREDGGLALSSRNARLSVEERKNALKISQTLFESRTFATSHTVAETQKFVEDAIAAVPGLRLEYFELVDGNTLQKIADWEDTSYAVGCITVFCGEVRLIDNIKYKE